MMKDKKIKVIIMLPSPLTPRWESMYCIDALTKVFDVEYWDCSKITYITSSPIAQLKRTYVKVITSLTSLKKELQLLPKDVVCISDIHPCIENAPIHSIITKYNQNRIYVEFGVIGDRICSIMHQTTNEPQTTSRKEYSQETIFQQIKHFLYKCETVEYICKWINHRNDGQFDEWKRSKRGWIDWSIYNRINIKTLPQSEYYINHPDYNTYLKLEQNPSERLIDGDYIVYVDQYFPKHPDLAFHDPHVDFNAMVQPFYASLNRFFSMIEREYHCPIVIAGHPSAKFEDNPFNGRQIVYYKTAELIKDCKAVIMHCSLSLSFVALWNKPLCFVTNQQMASSSHMRKMLENYSQAMNVALLDMDICGDGKNIFQSLSQNQRERYLTTFFDLKNKKTNEELLVENIIRIHHDLYPNA